jgi:hypothetical protein
MPTQIADIIVPAEFTAYIVENSLVSSALFQSGVAVPNGIMSAQLQAGAPGRALSTSRRFSTNSTRKLVWA